MFVLITGGAGFIGSHSAEACIAAGARVRVLDDLSSGHAANLAQARAQLEFVQGDIRDADCVQRCMRDVTHVLHLAAQVSVPASIAAPLHSHSINIGGFLNVLEAARQAGVTRMVYASSAAVYGAPALLPLDEASPAAPLSPYGLEKLVNDQYAALYAKLYDFPAVGMRYFNVYGARQDPRSPYSGVISKFAEWAIRGEPFTIHGNGRQTRDFVHVSDVARANLAALAAAVAGPINVATGRSVTLLELTQAFGQALGRTIEVRQQPARAGDIERSEVTPARMRNALGITDTLALPQGLRQLLDSLQGAA